MSLAINAFAESWGITGMTVSNQRLLRETESKSITSIVRQRQLWLYGHVALWWGKSMLPAGSYLVWEGGLHGDLHGVIAGAGVRAWARQCAPR